MTTCLPFPCLHLECSCRHGPLCYSESVLSINKERLRAFPFPCLHLECSCRHGPLQCSWSVLSVNEVAITCLSISFLFSPSLSLACLHLECSCRHEPLCYSESVLAINKERLRAIPFACLHLECSCRHGTAMLFRVSSVGEWRIKYMPFNQLLVLALLLVFISNVVVAMLFRVSSSNK